MRNILHGPEAGLKGKKIVRPHSPHSVQTVVVFAKIPGNGNAKSRIAATHGTETAADIYRQLCQMTAKILATVPHHVAFTGGPEPGPLAGIFTTALSFFRQDGATLGERLNNAFEHLFRQGYERVGAVGCDCPWLNAGVIGQAFDALSAGADIAVGPALDGGYYLIAARPGRGDIFSVRGWGGPGLCAETLALARSKGWQCETLETLRDIDTMEDWEAWKTGKMEAQ